MNLKLTIILTNRRSLKDIINCKTIPGEAVVSQHRLVVMDLRTRTQKKIQYQRVNKVKIKWWRLKDHAVADDYVNNVIDNMEYCEQPEWAIFSETVKEKGSEHCGSRLVASPCSNGRPGGGIQQSRRQ